MRALLALLPSCVLLAGAFVGCSGGLSSTPGDTTSDAASADTSTATDATADARIDGAGLDAATDATASGIWPADAESVVADSPGGGFTPTPPPGSACAYGAEHYTVDIKTSAFTFARCAAGTTPSDPLQLLTGNRTLTPAQLATVDAAMKQLTPPKDPKACGADKGVYTVTVKTPRDELTYYDSFYVCNGGGKLYVDNIDGVFAALTALAPLK
jgi:hypothetical protein